MARWKEPMVQHFTVEGGGHFPVDMLRYDTCWPSSQEDVAQAFAEKGVRKVRLSTPYNRVTEGRWLSFGWHVVTELS